MSQIPLSKSSTQASSHPGITVHDSHLSQNKPSIGITQAPAKPSIAQSHSAPNAIHPHGSHVVKMVNGVRDGLRPAHNVAVLDLTSDHTQFLPYMAHCDTCAWEGRYVSLALAEAGALGHAGK